MKYGLTTNRNGANVFIAKPDAEVICAEVGKMYPKDGAFTVVKAIGGYVVRGKYIRHLGYAYAKAFATNQWFEAIK